MNFLTRLRSLTAVLGLTAAVAVGSLLLGDFRSGKTPPTAGAGRPDGNRVTEELAQSRFSQLSTITYRLHTGETLFAWQVRPQLETAPARPRDVLVVVDTSASQAGTPLRQARQVLQGFAESCGPDDRIAVWLANTPQSTRPLTKDFVAPNSDELRNAAATLTEVEYGSGAVDLKIALEKATESFTRNRGRHQVVLFLGDGESAFAPVSEGERVALGGRMDQDDIFFFAVPLGVKVDPANLHGFASLTGGTVVRVQEDLGNASKRGEFVHRLKAALDVPVLKTEKVTFGPEVAEFFPTRLPPLRSDRSTLVIGKLAGPAEKISAKVSGKVVHKPVQLNLAEALTASRPDNYFLNVMLDQWRSAPHTDAPAILQADRALALASTQVKLYRDEFLTQAVWAIKENRLDVAVQMYEAAKKIDPNDLEADAGVKMTSALKAGKMTQADLAKRVHEKSQALKISKDEAVKMVLQEPVPAPAPVVNPPAEADLIREAQAKRAVEEQRYKVLVESTIRQARQLLKTNPDAAYQDLKRQLDDVRTYDALGDIVRRQLVADLEAQMRDIMTKGAEVKRQASAEREQVAITRQRLNEFDRQRALEDQTKARIDAFHQLMQQARYELAYQEAQIMIQDRISRGQTVPPQAVASYIIGQQATQLREWRELTRIRNDRFLMTMMQTEKSHIPYPDEPPVHFPPASVWRELTAGRAERYSNIALGPEPSQSQKALQSKVENQRVSIEGDLNNITLFDLLQNLSKKYDVTFIINEEAFKADNMEMMIREKKPNLAATRLDGLTLGAFLDIVLGSMSASFLVRPDYIEVTTQTKRLEEKVTRAFPVADLVISIPNSIALSGLQLNLSVQGAFSQQIAQANFLGNLGAGLNVGGMGGGAVGMAGQVGGANAGQFPQLGQGGNFLGIQGRGGNVGQFGNLGGQFGIQGQTQEKALIDLIVDVVARGEWKLTGNPQDPDAPMLEDLPGLTPKMFNSLGYYGPARALLIRGSSRYHPNSTVQLKPGGGMAALPVKPNGGALAIRPNDPKAPPANAVAQAGAEPGRASAFPKVAAQNLKSFDKKDPKKMWHQVIAATIEDPGVIVATAEFLMEFHEPLHAAEVLKANLRKGLATDSWAHEALAVALQASQSSGAEIERAATSALDLDPTSGKAYLRAAKAESDLKNYDRALSFCKRAAELSPDLPGAYANALVYAERSDNAKADVVDWAAGNLLRRDWPVDGIDYAKETRARLEKIVHKFEAAGRKDEAAPLQKTLTEQIERDLVIELRWEGSADLDLAVTEPSGAVCNATHKRTTGGGVLKADVLEQTDAANPDGTGGRMEEYAAAKAFNGTYEINVKKVLGQPVGNTAQVRVIKFKGTPRQEDDLITVDLSKPQAVRVTVDGGSRRELAVVPADEDEFRLRTTGGVSNKLPGGFGGGGGMAGSAMNSTVSSNAAPPLPNVNEAREERLPGMAPAAADLRATTRVNPDRRTVRLSVNPVFNGFSAQAVVMPTVSLLPGGR